MARKISNNSTSFQLFTGLAAMKVIAFNPTNEQYFSVTGREMPYALEYKAGDDGSFGNRVLVQIGGEADSVGEGTFHLVPFYTSATPVVSKNSGKTVYGNSKGQFAYLTGKDDVSMAAWFKSEDLRVAYGGEKELSELIKSLIGFNSKEDNFNKEAKLIQDFIKTNNPAKLNSLLKGPSGIEGIQMGKCGVGMLMVVKTNEETGKKSQGFVVKEGYITGTNIKPDGTISIAAFHEGRLEKAINRDKEGGYDVKGEYTIKLQEYTVVAPETPDNAVEVEDTDGDIF